MLRLSPHRQGTHRPAPRLGLALLVLALLAGIVTATATAKTKSCADQVIADWFDDGRIGKIYPLECYRQAIAKLPPDVLDYSNAKEEIARALAFAKQGKPDPGGSDPTPPTQTSTTRTDTTETNTTDTTDTTDTTVDTTETQTAADPTVTQTTDTAADPTVTQTTDTSGPSSVPVPLLVLGGLAVLLLAAGSAGYLRRRMGGSGDGDGTPPASA